MSDDTWTQTRDHFLEVLLEALTSRDPRLHAWPPEIPIAAVREFAALVRTSVQHPGDELDVLDVIEKLYGCIHPPAGAGPTFITSAQAGAVWAFRAVQLFQPQAAAVLAGTRVFAFEGEPPSTPRWGWHLDRLSDLRELTGYLTEPSRLLLLLLFAAGVPLNAPTAAIPLPQSAPGSDWESYYEDTRDWYSLTLRIDYLIEAIRSLLTIDGTPGSDTALLHVLPTAPAPGPPVGTGSADEAADLSLAVKVDTYPEIWLTVAGTTPQQDITGRGWKVGLQVNGSGSLGMRIRPRTDDWPQIDGAAAGDLESGTLTISRGLTVSATGPPALALGSSSSLLALTIDSFTLQVKGSKAPAWSVAADVAGIRLRVRADWLSTLGVSDPHGLELQFDLGMGGLTGQGFRFNGGTSGSLRFRIGRNVDFGPFRLGLETLRLGLGAASSQGMRLEVRLDATFDLSDYLHLALDGVGAFAAWGDPHFGMLRPEGFAVAVTMGGLTGGGMFRRVPAPSGDSYEGAVQLQLSNLGIGAFGIYEKPAGGKVSVVAVLGVRFSPGVTLPYGIMLIGGGGMFGINRRMDQDAIAARLADGTAADALFCDEPVRKANIVLPALRAMFPRQDDSYVFGPTIRFTWAGGVVTADLGVFVQLPAWQVTVLGRLQLPGAGNSLSEFFKLRIDVVGQWSMSDQVISITGALVDSTILGYFVVTGGTAVRLGYGHSRYFLVSVGGFHPGYKPEPCRLPTLDRVGASLTVDKDGVVIRLAFATYIALTPASMQFGALLSIWISGAGFVLEGSAGFDAIFRFHPRGFSAELYCKVSISWHGHSLSGADFRGVLSKDDERSPLVIEGTASIRIPILGTKTWHGRHVVGPEDPEAILIAAVVPVAVLIDQLGTQVTLPATWRDESTADRYVLRASATTAQAANPLVSPNARLTWAQPAVPLSIPLTRWGGIPLAAPVTLELSISLPGTSESVEDDFPRGQFADVSDAEALVAPAFLPAGSGFRWTGDETVEGPAVSVLVGGPAPTGDALWLGYASSVTAGPAPSAGGDWLPPPLTHPTDGRPGRQHSILSAEDAPRVVTVAEQWTVLGRNTPQGWTHGPVTSQAGALAQARVDGGQAVPLSSLAATTVEP